MQLYGYVHMLAHAEMTICGAYYRKELLSGLNI